MTGSMKHEVEAFVLAGGRSLRFGSNKALAEWEGRPLLAHALHVVEELGLSARVVCRDPDPYRPWASSFITSERPGLGPAEGIRVALLAAAAPWALVLGTDMPGVDTGLLRLLWGAVEDEGNPGEHGEDPGASAICFRDSSGRRHPLPGLYHGSLIDLYSGLGDAPALNALLDRAHARVLGPEDVPPGTDLDRRLRNVNRLEDLGS